MSAPAITSRSTGREERIAAFLAHAGWADAHRRPLGADWSTRRYERLTRADGATALLMDADGATAVQVAPFVRIGARLAGLGLSAPVVLAAHPDDGLAVVEDFGDTPYAAVLDRGGDAATPWRPFYERAVDVLIVLHRRFLPGADPADAALPRYDAGLFTAQAALFAQFWLPRRLGRELTAAEGAVVHDAWAEVLGRVLADPAQPPPSLLLRDYHPGNLMHLPARPGVAACGLIDFQDGGLGPRAYDLISLLEDARRDVPRDLADGLRARYLAAFPEVDAAAFHRGCAVLAAQRHARILGRVAQILAEDPRAAQAALLPRVEGQLAAALAHPALTPLRHILRETFCAL